MSNASPQLTDQRNMPSNKLNLCTKWAFYASLTQSFRDMGAKDKYSSVSLSLVIFLSVCVPKGGQFFPLFSSIITCFYSFHPPLHPLSKAQVIHTNSQLLVFGDFETTEQFLEQNSFYFLETRKVITIKQNLIFIICLQIPLDFIFYIMQ